MRSFEKCGNYIAIGALVGSLGLTACGDGVETCISNPQVSPQEYPGDGSNKTVIDKKPATWLSGITIGYPDIHKVPNGAQYVSVGYNVPDNHTGWKDSGWVPIYEVMGDDAALMKIGEHGVSLRVRLKGVDDAPACVGIPEMQFSAKASLVDLARMATGALVEPKF
jgi:hypothetical protein